MIEAELIITLRKDMETTINLFSFEYEGIEYVLTKEQIQDFENRYKIRVILKEPKVYSHDAEPTLSDMDFIHDFFKIDNLYDMSD